MKISLFARTLLLVYGVLFFGYLMSPLLVMAISSINTPPYPQAWPFEGMTFTWFESFLGDEELRYALLNSIWIGFLVVCVSVPCGLAAAMLMTQLLGRAKNFYYVVAIAPILTPGIVIGISTVVFWRDFSGILGLRDVFYQGTVMTVLAQSSYITAFSMLIILARLQSFDQGLEEAAHDLGATHFQAFCHVLLPFLRPALLSAAALGFLSSFQDYNTTTFAILSDKTLTTVLSARVRMGSSPVVSAVGTGLVAATILFVLVGACVKSISGRRPVRSSAEAV